MSTHGEQHEGLVLAVVAGELAEASPEVVRRISECAVCAAQIARLRAVAARLDEEAREELAILALAERVSDAPGLDRVEALRRRPDVRRGPPPRGFRPRAVAWAGAAGVAAALMLLLLLRAAGSGPERDPGRGAPDEMLGGEQLRLLPFDGFGDDLELRFEASSAIQGDVAKWELSVEGVAADGKPFDAIIEATNPWSDPAQAREFPDEITVTVRALNASGDTLARSDPVSGRRAR